MACDPVGQGSHPGSRLLAALAARYAGWLGLPAATTGDVSDEDPAAVRAMPLVLRLERGDPPPRSALLEAAATAAVALCCDERSAPGGAWHGEVAPWVAGRIRKVARRARGAHWDAVGELPGVTISHRGAQVRALLPWPVSELPRVVSRLQVGGTDVPADEPGPPPPDVPVLWLAPGLELTAGKAAAQVGHASMLLAALLDPTALAGWERRGFATAVRCADPARWSQLAPGADPERDWRERGVVAVRDAGFTEISPGTVTVAAAWS